MANPDRQGQPRVRRTEQDIINAGFDELFQIPAVMLVAYNSDTATLDRVQINSEGQLLSEGEGYFVSDTDEAATSPQYFGYLTRSGLWYIMKKITAGNIATYRYIKGDSGYSANWTGRAGLTYDYYNTVF